MSDFEDKLNGILSNPDAMAQIANLAQSLNLGGGGGGAQPEEPANASPALPPGGSGSPAAGLGGLAGLGDLLGQIDPGMIQMGMDVFRQVQSAEDRNTALLNALRPFLKEDRQARLDRALRIARTAKLVRAALGVLGRKEGERV